MPTLGMNIAQIVIRKVIPTLQAGPAMKTGAVIMVAITAVIRTTMMLGIQTFMVNRSVRDMTHHRVTEMARQVATYSNHMLGLTILAIAGLVYMGQMKTSMCIPTLSEAVTGCN